MDADRMEQLEQRLDRIEEQLAEIRARIAPLADIYSSTSFWLGAMAAIVGIFTLLHKIVELFLRKNGGL